MIVDVVAQLALRVVVVMGFPDCVAARLGFHVVERDDCSILCNMTAAMLVPPQPCGRGIRPPLSRGEATRTGSQRSTVRVTHTTLRRAGRRVGHVHVVARFGAHMMPRPVRIRHSPHSRRQSTTDPVPVVGFSTRRTAFVLSVLAERSHLPNRVSSSGGCCNATAPCDTDDAWHRRDNSHAGRID